MQISVVIPTYRRPSLLTRCIDALEKQQFDHTQFEILVVSDGYDAETEEALLSIIERIDFKMRYFALPVKLGPAAARNVGWKQAQAPLILFTDDDCIPDNNWIKSIYDLHVKNDYPQEIAYTGKTIVPIPDMPTDYEKNISHLSEAEFITANCAVTKAALIRTGGFDERFTMAWREDSDLQFKLMLERIPLIKNENAIVTHPVRKASWGVSLKDEKKGIFNSLLYKKYPDLYKQKIQPSPPWNYYFIILSFLIFIAGFLSSVQPVAIVGFTFWFGATAAFVSNRLTGTTRSWKHTAEMIFTSMFIPFLSVYYRIYGAVKYRSPLIP
jgi:glycosyltransferase involved in cell wall biosynthesis